MWSKNYPQLITHYASPSLTHITFGSTEFKINWSLAYLSNTRFLLEKKKLKKRSGFSLRLAFSVVSVLWTVLLLWLIIFTSLREELSSKSFNSWMTLKRGRCEIHKRRETWHESHAARTFDWTIGMSKTSFAPTGIRVCSSDWLRTYLSDDGFRHSFSVSLVKALTRT